MAAPMPRVPPVTSATRPRLGLAGSLVVARASPVRLSSLTSCLRRASESLVVLRGGLLQLGQHGRVAKGGSVAGIAALRDIAQQPAHDLAGPGLGHVLRPDDPLRPGEFADAL